MKIAQLLEHHQKFASRPHVLSDSLGDGFLVSNNRFFGAIRRAVVAAGFRLSHDAHPAYRALPLSQLDWILKNKTIPYIDNVSVLREVELKIPRVSVWDDVSDNLKGNAVFHESCHGVARSVAFDFQHPRAQVLKMLVEESFANTCELLSITDAGDPAHRIFLELNSYIFMNDDRTNLRNALNEIGAERVFVFLMLSYLHANFLRPISDRDFERLFALAQSAGALGAVSGSPLDVKSKKTLRALSKIAFQLNPRFREVTTRFYLRLSGVASEMPATLDFDFLQVIETSASALSALSELSRSACSVT